VIKRAVVTKVVPVMKKSAGSKKQVFGRKSQVSEFVNAHVEVIAAINATDATSFHEPPSCLPLSDP
jgi:hypothetical protein